MADIDLYIGEPLSLTEPFYYGGPSEAAVLASVEGRGGTGGGVGQGQLSSFAFTPDEVGGFWESVKTAASTVSAVIEAPFKAVGGVLTGVQRTGEYLPWILFGLGAVALITFLPKGGVYRVAPRRRK